MGGRPLVTIVPTPSLFPPGWYRRDLPDLWKEENCRHKINIGCWFWQWGVANGCDTAWKSCWLGTNLELLTPSSLMVCLRLYLKKIFDAHLRKMNLISWRLLMATTSSVTTAEQGDKKCCQNWRKSWWKKIARNFRVRFAYISLEIATIQPPPALHLSKNQSWKLPSRLRVNTYDMYIWSMKMSKKCATSMCCTERQPEMLKSRCVFVWPSSSK